MPGQNLENLLRHPTFLGNEYTTTFVDSTSELFEFPKKRDRATRLLTYIADVSVNGHPETASRARAERREVLVPKCDSTAPANGLRQLLDEQGPGAVASWLLQQKRLLVTDTTMRDAHQSLLATRMRSLDMIKIAPAYSRSLALTQELVEQYPGVPLYLADLGNRYSNMASSVQQNGGAPERALALAEKGAEVYAEYFSQHRGDIRLRLPYLVCLWNVGQLQELVGAFDEASATYERLLREVDVAIGLFGTVAADAVFVQHGLHHFDEREGPAADFAGVDTRRRSP